MHYQDLCALTTLSVGQADDLKIDAGDVRVWVSRVGPADGAQYEHAVEIEVRDADGAWHNAETIDGDDSTTLGRTLDAIERGEYVAEDDDAPTITLIASVPVYVVVNLATGEVDRVVVDDEKVGPYTSAHIDDTFPITPATDTQRAAATAIAESTMWPSWDFGW